MVQNTKFLIVGEEALLYCVVLATSSQQGETKRGFELMISFAGEKMSFFNA